MGDVDRFIKEQEEQVFQTYDLVLYYINDHLYTPASQLASDLRSRLLDIGLPPGHEKNVVMAGLVNGRPGRPLPDRSGRR
jgi:hypothetical protein